MTSFIGTIYQRGGRLIDARIIQPKQRPDRRIVGTSRNQGYKRTRPALVPLVHLLLNGPHEVYDIDGTPVPLPKGKKPMMVAPGTRWKLPTTRYVGRVVPGANGKFEWEIRSRNGNLVFSSHNQGYDRAGKVKPDGTVAKGTALATLVALAHGADHTVDFDLRVEAA